MSESTYDLYQKLSRLQWLLQRRHLRRHMERGPAADPSRGQGRVLALLRLQPGISTRDLSYLLGIRQQSLNELLHKLEKAEYITRTPSEEDRRVMLVHLTEKGKEVPTGDPASGGLFDCLNDEEREAFGGYLDRIITSLESSLGVDAEEDERFARMGDFRSRMGEEEFARMFAGRGRGHGHPHGDFRGPRGPHGPHDPRGPHGPHGAYDGGMPPFDPEDEPEPEGL